MDALFEMTTKLDDGFDRLSVEVKMATAEMKAYIRTVQFENVRLNFPFKDSERRFQEVGSPLKNLREKFQLYLKHPSVHPEFQQECAITKPENIIGVS